MPDYGVVIGWVPGNYSQRVQVARSADDGSGNPDTTTTTLLATALPDQTYYYDALPPDNAFRHYQVRHVLTGLIDGAWSSYVRAKPKLVPPSYLDSVGDQTSPASAALPSSYTVGDFLYASAAAALSKRAAVATGNLLISQGASTAPAWGKLASTHLSGDYTFPGSLTITGTLSGVTTLTATTIGGTLSTAAQANVTSLGTLAANLLFVDATYDIGASGATRPRDFFLSRNATIGGTVTSVGLLTAQAGLTVSGGLTSLLGILQTGGIAVRLENTFADLPAGAAGQGLEIGTAGGLTYLQVYNRTTAAYAPLMFTASTYSFENTGSSTISASGIAVTVGALTATTGAFSDDVIITSASATPLTIARSGGAATSMIMRTGASKYAWQMAAQFYTDAGLDFVPSTAVGGTTFTTPVFGLTQAGPATFYGNAVAMGALTATTVTVGSTPLVIQEYGLERSSNLDDLEVAINYDGYGATRFRNFSVYDGKHNLLFRITGSTSAASFQNNSVSMGALTATTVTGTGLFLTPASASGGAGLRLPHGAAPSSPTDGDIWTTTAGLYVRINGGTVGPLT